MADKENVVKMQKLRRAVERLRNMRASGTAQPVRKKTWFERLKARLGLGTPENATQ
ncbi:MAG TPA: hypothetical protein PLJ78_05370 [Anaerolineae bacterium]|nr:hypothetical protein [Anaerolineae bacterium]HQK13357.1 hypothetical protein [Anaerolineae bacterium]